MKINYPKVNIDSNQKVFISFLANHKRYRLYSGTRIGSQLNPNSFPPEQRESIGKLLAAETYNYLSKGGVLENYRTTEVVMGRLTDKQYLFKALDKKLNGTYSEKYEKILKGIYKAITQIMNGDDLLPSHVNTYLDRYSSGVSFNTIRRHLNVLINEAERLGMEKSPLLNVKSRKAKATLNKPFKDVSIILKEIKAYSNNLHLCCVMTYGCLLRPHREIRGLTWGDFSEDLSYINLSGLRNKSGKNRIVPVPSYIKDLLIKGEPNTNVFTGNKKPLNEDYFKTLWSRFKAQTTSVEVGQTLYSFRHSGAIEIFKRTGSLTKLQKAMGHSSLNVSLTYLRGLEVAELMEEDMPMISALA